MNKNRRMKHVVAASLAFGAAENRQTKACLKKKRFMSMQMQTER